MKAEEQLKLWVAGRPVHNKEQNECCPDFSCCQPRLLAPKHEREAFLKAFISGNEKAVTSMLIEFLKRSFPNIKIYIAGGAQNKKKEKTH